MHLSSVQPQHYVLDSGPADSLLIGMIAPYKAEMEVKMDEVIGQCAVSLYKDKPVGTLGSWACDAVAMEVAAVTGNPVDFVVLNYGGLRISELAPGPVTVGEIYELMPFDNMVTILEGDGRVVQQLFDFIAATGGWPVSKDVRFGIRDGIAVQPLVGGASLDPDRSYRFVVPDYLANGGDNLIILTVLPRESPDLLIRDALIMHVRRAAREGKPVSAAPDDRIYIAKN